MYAVTGASGQLGRLVVEALLRKVEPAEIIALVRDPAKVADFATKGVVVRPFDYSDQASLPQALAGVKRLLLISSNELGQREAQHRGVIDAAKAAGVSFIAYTSILRADSSPMGLAAEHRATEVAILESGLPYAFLRNGWYNENYTASAKPSVEHGAVLGSTGEGRISAAARVDYAEAAVAVLVETANASDIYELAGDESFTLADYGAILAEASGKPVSYVHMSEEAYRGALEGIGLPAPVAAMLAESSATAAGGALFDDSHTLSNLIGRPTMTLAASVAKALE